MLFLYVLNGQVGLFLIAIFYDIRPKQPKSLIFLKILTFPNYLSLRESTDIKSAQKFQLKPGQNPIGKCIETGVYLIILGF